MKAYWTPELLAPAGSLEKLKVAIMYGANAVYLGGQKFGLRSAADNFTYEEILEACEFAHSRDAKVYVVLNSFLHDKEIEELPSFLQHLEKAKVDALIISDLGVIQTVRQNCHIPVHLSTQASCLNTYAAQWWKKMGVTRIVLGREVSIDEARAIKEATGLELEMFIHGSMCMAYSGNCVISNYTQGRDSNRGGCAHSCRFEYSLGEENSLEQKKAFFMSSKDLEGLRVLQDFIDAGIDSLKVEGRMKSHHYVGTISKVYGEALRYYQQQGHLLSDDLLRWEEELEKVTHRDYTLASLKEKAGEDSIYAEREHNNSEFTIAGMVLEATDDHTLVEVRSRFTPNDRLEIIPFSGASTLFTATEIKDLANRQVEYTRPGTLVKLPPMKNAKYFNLIRLGGQA